MKILKFKEDFVAFWGGDKDAQRKIAEAAVIEAFREGLISSQKSAELLDISKREFLEIILAKKITVDAETHQQEKDWMYAPKILELILEREKKVAKEIEKGDFITLDDLQSELGV
ncbi:MAG: UPF0175 family protein [Candidatus Eremiobacteraeota bacterium]|nr:UPF0175 family protein [Candidatus Eremiobacteraeota bacterium]